jgi:hypothetical protein
MDMTTTNTPNGISWMLSEQQCPVTQQSLCIQMHAKEDPVEDKILKAWEEAHPKPQPPIDPAEQERLASLEAPIVRSIPSYSDIARQHEQPLAA